MMGLWKADCGVATVSLVLATLLERHFTVPPPYGADELHFCPTAVEENVFLQHRISSKYYYKIGQKSNLAPKVKMV